MFECDGCPPAELLARRLMTFPVGELQLVPIVVELALLTMGIALNVDGHEASTEIVWLFDMASRILASCEWNQIERGWKRRIRALSTLVDDIPDKRSCIRRRRGEKHRGFGVGSPAE